jgi:hypothetical protein
MHAANAAQTAGACICPTAGQAPLPQQDQSLLIRLRHLYLCEQLSTYRIGQITGLDRQRVARLLRKANVPLRPKGAGAVQPPRRRGEPANLPEILAELYVQRHLTIRQIAKLMGIPAATVRNRLRRYGIRTRTQGAWEREGRRVLPADDLWNLYCHERLSADDVGHVLDASRKVVLRNAHDLGIPVRTGGVAAWSGPSEIELVDALYADELIDAALAMHEVPRVPAGGPIWQRFPTPVPLTKQLIEDLYCGCGVGLSHIELLTGQPAQTVGRLMHGYGITTRHPGGHSPFLQRWRAGSS